VYLTKNRFGVYLICYRDGDGKEHRVSSHTRIKKAAYGKFSKFNIPKEPNRKPDYKSILAHIQATRSAKTYRMYKDIINFLIRRAASHFRISLQPITKNIASTAAIYHPDRFR